MSERIGASVFWSTTLVITKLPRGSFSCCTRLSTVRPFSWATSTSSVQVPTTTGVPSGLKRTTFQAFLNGLMKLPSTAGSPTLTATGSGARRQRTGRGRQHVDAGARRKRSVGHRRALVRLVEGDDPPEARQVGVGRQDPGLDRPREEEVEALRRAAQAGELLARHRHRGA